MQWGHSHLFTSLNGLVLDLSREFILLRLSYVLVYIDINLSKLSIC